MQWRNKTTHWGLTAVLLHWIVALVIFSLFALGSWMTELSYYDAWYKQSLSTHKSIGLLLALTVLLRVLWRQWDRAPAKLVSHASWERVMAKLTHVLLYLLLPLIFISGYLISTADGRGISIFGVIEIPATIQDVNGQEELAGKFHLYSAYTMMVLIALHIVGALKHQWIDKDGTLTRMLGREPR
jgi:cytochrome b561